MRLVYIDDSQDDKCEVPIACFSAVVIDALRWHEVIAHWRGLRAGLKESHGLYASKELHATKLLSWHGHYFERRPTPEHIVATFSEILAGIAAIPTARIFNACGPLSAIDVVLERLLTRVDRTMQEMDEHAIVICDNGKTYDDLLERLRRENRIHRRYGTIDVPLRRIIEDLVYRDSADSDLVQVADACAYTLLRRERPLPRLEEHRFSQAFLRLAPICATEASRYDAHGIIRCWDVLKKEAGSNTPGTRPVAQTPRP